MGDVSLVVGGPRSEWEMYGKRGRESVSTQPVKSALFLSIRVRMQLMVDVLVNSLLSPQIK